MKSKGPAIIAAWLLGVGLLLFIMVQMQSYASIINNAGVVRGGTQRAVKLELVERSNSETVQRVDSLLAQLRSGEDRRLVKSAATKEFVTDVEAVQQVWDLIKDEFDKNEQSEESREHLISLSEEHFVRADKMVLSAQHRAESDFVWIIAVSLTLVAIVSAFVSLLERHHRLKMRTTLLTDPLTGGHNQLAFEEQGAHLIESNPNTNFVVAYSNVTGFRTVNESFGRAMGDKAICALQRLFDQACKENELVAHINADHFALLLTGEGDGKERLRAVQSFVDDALQNRPDLPVSGQLTCGYGAFSLPGKHADLTTAISNASAVLKEGASIQGISWYDDAFRQQLMWQNDVRTHCEQGLRNNEFQPFFQPQVSLSTKELMGAELLCRWDSPELGFLTPDKFIPFFERNGFITKLDFHMIEQACKHYPMVQRDSNETVCVAVNLSRITILQAGFVDRLVELFKRYHIPPRYLEIEVTEGLFSVDESAVLKKLNRLRALGFRFAMDDFGTGYSSLSLLRKLPIDVLKIDRSFLSESTESKDALRVLKSVIDLANDLDISTVCEGIEHAEQAELLSRLGCTVGQGFLFDRPLPIDEFAKRYRVEVHAERPA